MLVDGVKEPKGESEMEQNPRGNRPRPRPQPQRRESSAGGQNNGAYHDEREQARARAKAKARARAKARIRRRRRVLAALLVLLCITLGIFFIVMKVSDKKTDSTDQENLADGGDGENDGTDGDPEGNRAVAEPTATPDPEAITEFKPTHTDETNPSRMIEYTNIMVNGDTLGSINDYKAKEKISFEDGRFYTDLEGVITFRGNNFRNAPSYGTAPMSSYTMKKMWNIPTGSMTTHGAYWSGNGWTGQPLLVRWPASTKKHMNMKKWAKQDDDLVEAVYASMDGNIYFFDIKTGKKTRETIHVGYVFKGAGALDPRGYPILYVGSGYDSPNGTSHAFIISLIDGKILHEYGAGDPFSLRGHLSYFDSSALVDAETDTLIQPGENGILYLIKLNTKYDEENGTLSIDPGRTVKWRYHGKRSGSTYWLGMEDSCAIYKGYLFVSDNGGHLMCLDLNTLKLKWVQDILDDSNSTPVLSAEDGKLYLYISTSFHLGWRSSSTAKVPIWKIDASDGSVVWKKNYTCYSREGNSGGVQSTIALGKNSLDKYIYVTVGRTGSSAERGVIVCLKKKNGHVVFEQDGPYSWSSPVCVYNQNEGKDVVIYARCDSHLMMLDGKSGETLDELDLGSGTVEASPAVFDDTLVVGTRGCNIFGVQLE